RLAKWHNLWGRALQKLGRVPEAREALEEAVALQARGNEQSPKDPERRAAEAAYRNALAWLLATCADGQFRDPPRAGALAAKAAELDPKNREVWNTLGVTQYQAGDFPAAIESLERSRKLNGDRDSFDYFFLAMARWQLGEKDKAKECYDEAVQ